MSKFQARVLWGRSLGWSHDLPQINETPTLPYGTESIKPSPNNFNNIYLELPRSSFGLRGVVALFSIPILIPCAILVLYVYWTYLVDGLSRDWVFDLFAMLMSAIGLWASIFYVKLDLTLPRDEPIRFNRLRRKIYFYQYRSHYIYLFSRKRWGLQPVAHNWDDVTAEVYRVYAPGHGGLIENVMLSVRNPETNEVIDRVFFTHTLDQGKAYWAIARLFMQQGPEALPKFVHPPRDWNDDDGLSHMHCLAPKVQWPADIDRESRTAPSEEDAVDGTR
ncbi:DUF6708 domain-containing protein [Pseudomonas sp.]|uniref:DUF6708 domain-containing protein n=1 Tax=Pseudomonas sp. TaxID=306 RepID=UPI0027B8C6AB|nr:DUF6708 domain-containing protein [Pseudomonas sp.]